MIRLSLFLSYTASILFVPCGSPIQKFLIWAGLRDTKDPSRLVLQNCAPFQKKRMNIYCSVTVYSDTVQMSCSITKSMFKPKIPASFQNLFVPWTVRTINKTLEILKYIFILRNFCFVHPWRFLLTFKKKDLSPDICHRVKASLTALVERGVRTGKDKLGQNLIDIYFLAFNRMFDKIKKNTVAVRNVQKAFICLHWSQITFRHLFAHE